MTAGGWFREEFDLCLYTACLRGVAIAHILKLREKLVHRRFRQ
ncbi:MAG: hypothetical protein ACHBN1_29470 [Heteroscytonema crispum UTEX LB 1556]